MPGDGQGQPIRRTQPQSAFTIRGVVTAGHERRGDVSVVGAQGTVAAGQDLFPFRRILGAEDDVSRDFLIACLDRIDLLESGFPIELHDGIFFCRVGNIDLGVDRCLIEHRGRCVRPKVQSPAGILPLADGISRIQASLGQVLRFQPSLQCPPVRVIRRRVTALREISPQLQRIENDAWKNRHVCRVEGDVQTAFLIGRDFAEFDKICPRRERFAGRTAGGFRRAAIHGELGTRARPGVAGKQPKIVFLPGLQPFDGDARTRATNQVGVQDRIVHRRAVRRRKVVRAIESAELDPHRQRPLAVSGEELRRAPDFQGLVERVNTNRVPIVFLRSRGACPAIFGSRRIGPAGGIRTVTENLHVEQLAPD